MRLGKRSWRVVAAAGAVAVLATACASPVIGVVGRPGSGGGGGSGESNGSGGPGSPGAGDPRPRDCAQPDGGSDFERVDPLSVQLDPRAVEKAITYATDRGAQSVRVYRHDCLVGTSGMDAETGWSKLPAWSMTKGVVSTVLGRAVTLGLLDVDDPIGDYLTGLNDKQQQITVRQLLTQTSGMRFAWVNDLNDAANFDSVKRLFQRPFEAEPGTTWIYAQTTVTALVAVVEAATGEDFQAFAAREVFEPIGIDHSEWTWKRDGGGRTQGFAFLDMTPKAFGRIGSLLANNGSWNDERFISADYIAQGSVGTDINTGYGFLWATNNPPAGVEESEDEINAKIASATPRTFWLSGLFNQNVFVVPELDIVVVRMGLPADIFGDPYGESDGVRPEWEHQFFRLLLAGVTDQDIPDPGPWKGEPPSLPVDSEHIIWIDTRGLDALGR